ncbi:MAG TPA: hypothetical protein DIW45_02410 [Erythrobacter sp.]|nr:hypothetical protein [Erythrobacter sp.]
MQPVEQAVGNVDVAGARRDVDQRPVEIEEQRRGTAVQQSRQWRRGRKLVGPSIAPGLAVRCAASNG